MEESNSLKTKTGTDGLVIYILMILKKPFYFLCKFKANTGATENPWNLVQISFSVVSDVTALISNPNLIWLLDWMNNKEFCNRQCLHVIALRKNHFRGRDAWNEQLFHFMQTILWLFVGLYLHLNICFFCVLRSFAFIFEFVLQCDQILVRIEDGSRCLC